MQRDPIGYVLGLKDGHGIRAVIAIGQGTAGHRLIERDGGLHIGHRNFGPDKGVLR